MAGWTTAFFEAIPGRSGDTAIWRHGLVLPGWLALLLTLALGGCGSTGPAPVVGWGWNGPVPNGYYRVREGDTLGEIALRQGVELQRLARWNALKPPYVIYRGSLLRVAPPGQSARRAVAQAPAKAAVSASSGAARTAQTPGKSAPATTATVSAAASSPQAASRRAASGVPWEWPLSGPLLQTFREGDRTRSGIRIGGQPGQAVLAAADGKVVYSGDGLKGYGNLIIIKHNEKYLSAYGFNRRLLVREGEAVKCGQPVAEVGQGPEGAYLMHFEIRRHGTVVDPLLYLPALK